MKPPQKPADFHEIPYDKDAATQLLELAKEVEAKRAYAQMLRDAEFPPGSIVDTKA